MKLEDPISTIPLIGPKYQKTLSKLDITTIGEFIAYFPRNYFDSSKIHKIEELSREEKKAFKAVLLDIKNTRTRKRNFTIQTGLAEDESGAVELIWFNQPYIKDTLEVGKEYIFSGKLNPKSYKPQVQSPQFEEVKAEQTHLGLITPIYALTDGISNKWLRSRMKWLIDKLEYITDLEETLPTTTIKKYNLISQKEALRNIHFPKSQRELKQAKHRLGFEELYQIQLQIQKEKLKYAKQRAPIMGKAEEQVHKMIRQLNFELTKDQQKAIEEITKDLKTSQPMNRLLSGDVGSGKTIVAIAATLLTVKNDHQVAILAPTTVLAEQHYQTFKHLLKEFKLNVTLISGKTNSKEIENSDVVIGTHAILYKKYKLFTNLGLVIIDEQHRFGVSQREELRETFSDTKNGIHTLTMTATPIPRTLALTLFGDLDVSEIKEKPNMRKPVKTHIVPENKRSDAYKWINEKAQEDIQVFWVAPLIEESEKLEATSVNEVSKVLGDKLPETKKLVLHGKMKEEEKQDLLKKFKNYSENKVNILISTSVIEVGIDIPNANIIVIEGAERFGLAQLHQLRGRVGRSDQQAWCFLFTSNEPTEEQQERLKYFSGVNDGFKLAEYDLTRRGPGEVYGTRQSGIPNLKIANIFDLKLVKETREAAQETLSSN